MGILLPALSQNGPTKLVVWIFGGQSIPIVPPLRPSLCEMVLLPNIFYIFFLLLIPVPSLAPSAFAGSPLFPGYMSNPSTGFSAPSPPGYTGNPLANNLSANLFNTQSMFK
jgi:hypothetical protein